MEAGNLQVTVVKGPKNGETLVWNPRSKVRIGRVIKGNDFALRDPGISQKHLCFQFVPETSRWFVSDLDSSNGTILNESMIQPLVPVPISDGDVIKIGEKTELGVKIVPVVSSKENEEENGGVVKGRRFSTRLNLARVSARGSSSRGSEHEEVKEDDLSVSVPVMAGKNNDKPNLARVSNEEEKKVESLETDFGPDLMDKMAQKGGRVRGQTRKDAKDNANGGFEEKMEDNRNLSVQIEEPDKSRGVNLRRNPRRGNSLRALKEVDMNRAVDVDIEAKGVPMKRKERKGKEIEVSDDGASDCVIIMDEEKVFFKAKTMVNSSMVTGEEKGDRNVGSKEGLEVNCENMTLEQWFDSMELFLPKVICDESEKVINILNEKSRKFEEFIEVGGCV